MTSLCFLIAATRRTEGRNATKIWRIVTTSKRWYGYHEPKTWTRTKTFTGNLVFLPVTNIITKCFQSVHNLTICLLYFISQDKLHSKTDAAFDRFRKAAQETVSKPSSAAPTNAQVRLLKIWDFFEEYCFEMINVSCWKIRWSIFVECSKGALLIFITRLWVLM